MVNVYLSGSDARNAAADLWQQDQLKQLNDQFAPPPPAPEPAQFPFPAPVEAAGVQGSSLPSPAAAGPVGISQPAPPAAVPAAPAAPNPTPDRNQIADQWQRSAIADAWEQNAISDVTKGVSQAGQGVQSALADVPKEAQGLVSNYSALPGATAPQPAQQAPTGISGIPAPQPTQGQVATVTGGQPQDLQSYARQAAQRNGVDPDIFQRQIQQESGFRTDAISPAGAVGVAQFMPATARGMGVDPTDPYASLDGAARLMSQNLNRYGGDYTKALAAYNAGPGNVDKYGGVPPFEETQRYVKTILAGGGGQQAASTDTQPISRPADDWLAIAKEQLGKPYIWGSAGGRSTFDPNAPGFDCSGFVSYVMKKAFGVDLPAFTGTAYTATRPLQEGETPGAAGQVAFYNMGQSDPHLQHIALSIGNGQVIQAGGRRNDVNTDVANDIGTPEWRVPVGIPGKLADAAQQVVGAGAAAAQAGQNVQQAVQQTAQGIIGAVGNVGGAIGTTASNVGSTLNSPDLPGQIYQHSPIGAFNAGLQGIGQNVVSPAIDAITQPGGPLVGSRTAAAGVLESAASNVPSGVPVVGGALQAAAGIVGGPTVLDQIGMVQDLAQKYPSGVPGLPDVSKMTPQDQAQWSSLMVGVGGITGGEGAGGESLAPKAGNNNIAGFFQGTQGAMGESILQADLQRLQAQMNAARAKFPDMTDAEAMTTPLGQQIESVRQQLAQRTGAPSLPATEPGGVSAPGAGQPANTATVAPGGGGTVPPVRPPAPPTGATPPIGGGPLAPKASNINLAQYPTEVQDVIQAAAPMIPESATRGVVPDAVVRDLAAMSGTSVPDIVANWKPGQAQNAETLLALRDSLVAQGRQVLDAQQALRANPDSADAQAMLVQALTQHRELQTVVSGSTAEWGRAGRVFQQPVEGNIVALQQLQNLAQRTGQSVDQLARDLAGMDLNDPAQMAQVARVLNPPRLPPNEALPVGPQPGQLHLFENAPVDARMEPPSAGNFETPNVPTPAQTPEQADFLRRGMTLKALQTNGPLPDIPYQGPTAQNLQGAPSGRPSPPTATMRLPGFPNPQTATPLEIFRAYHTGNVVSSPATAVHVALNSVLSPAWSLGTRGVADVLGGTLNAATGAPTGNLGRAIGRGAAVGSAMAEFGRNLAQGFSEFYANPANVANKIDNPLASGLLKVQQAVGAALHSSFQNASQAATTRLELAAQAGERAWNEGARGQELMNRIGDLMTNPTPDMLARAQDVGTRAALRGSAGATQQVMQKIAEIPFIGNTLFPVVRIGAQSIAQGVEKSPLGLMGTGFDVARAAAGKGPYAGAGGFSQVGGAVTPLADRLTNNLAGTALTTFLTFKALDGTITGNGPDDPKARATLQSQGWQPNSVLTPRGYMDYHALGPLAIPFSIAGNIGDSILYSKPQPGESGGDQVKAATLDLTRRVADYLASGTGMRTIGDMWDLIHGGGNAAAVGAQFAGSVAGGFVPLSAALRAGVAATDPFQRRPESGNVQQVVQQGLPGGTPLIGGRQDLPIRQDVLGRPEANPQQGIGAVLPRTGTGQPDPMLMLLSRAGIDLPATAPKTISYSGRQIQLTPDEQQQRQTLFGQRLQQTMQGYLKSEKFQALPPEQQYKALEPVVRAASTYADQRLVAEMPAADRKARMASAPRAYGAGVVPYLAAGSGSGGLASLIARQSGAEADAAHQRLIAQYSSQPAQPQLAAAS